MTLVQLQQKVDDHVLECDRIRAANLQVLTDIKKAVQDADKRMYMYIKEDSFRWMKILFALLVLALGSTGALMMLILKS
jgi:hypothetical protein